MYRARDLRSDSVVALKVLDPFLAQDETHLERFHREVAVLRALAHSHIVKIYSFFREGEFHVIAMECVDGVDAKIALRQRGAFTLDEFHRIARGAADALETCHRAGILHRDLKPQNLLIDSHGEPRLVDFGVAKISTMSDLTKTGTVIGSPEYMAPELFRTTRSDPRSDVYSLGAIFYELLSDRPPFGGGSLGAVMTRQLEGPPDPIRELRPEVPEWLEAVVQKCLHFDPDERFQSPGEVLAELGRGEQALALSQRRSTSVECLGCEAPMLPGLPFCWKCGALGPERVRRGGFSLVVNRASDPDGLAEHLAESFPRSDVKRLARALASPPCLLLRGIDESAARSLLNALVTRACDVGLVTALPTQFKLPRSYAVAAVAFAPLLLFGIGLLAGQGLAGISSALLGAATVALGEACVLALYRRRTRPALALGREQAADAAEDDGVQQAAAARAERLWRGLAEVGDHRLRRTLGHLAAQLARIASHGGRNENTAWSQELGVDALEQLVHGALKSARRLERYEAYLADRTLMEVKERMDSVALRLERTTDVDEIDALVKASSDLGEELRNYREIDELHSRTQLCILSIGGVLERIEGAQRRREEPGETLGELDRLGSLLTDLESQGGHHDALRSETASA